MSVLSASVSFDRHRRRGEDDDGDDAGRDLADAEYVRGDSETYDCLMRQVAVQTVRLDWLPRAHVRMTNAPTLASRLGECHRLKLKTFEGSTSNGFERWSKTFLDCRFRTWSSADLC